MECEIGEIRKVGNKWLQCIEGICNKECYFYNRSLHKTIAGINGNDFGACNACFRSDNKSVIFKELEKIEGPYDDCGTILQRFKIYTNVTNADTKGLELHIYSDYTIGIEIKQNKEDMEEYKMYDAKEDILEFDKVVDECLFGEDKLNLKPFDLQKAREGKPVYTRDGRKARIVCFDREFIYKGQNYCIVALIKDGPYSESLYSYTEDGLFNPNKIHNNDLMMLPEKKEGWINVYALNTCYSSKEEAEANIDRDYEDEYVRTVKINWEE